MGEDSGEDRAGSPGAPHSRCAALQPPRRPHSRCSPPVAAQSLQALTVAAQRCSPPGAPYSRCRSPGPHSRCAALQPSVRVRIAGSGFRKAGGDRSEDRPLTVAAQRCSPQAPAPRCPSQLGPLLYRSCSAKMFCPNVLLKCSLPKCSAKCSA